MTANRDTIEKMLLRVEKPGRYAGGERHMILKTAPDFRFVISYPDLYEIGMSNAGIKIIYELINDMEGFACERVFCPAPDLTAELDRAAMPLFTIESRTALNACDAIGFNYSSELLVTNILHILRTGGVPLLASERAASDPFVIIGGECASNPGPVAPFADMLYIGDAEESLPALLAAIQTGRAAGEERMVILKRAASVKGVFVPALYERVHEDGWIGYRGTVVKKNAYRGELKHTSRPLVPSIKVSHERCVVEISRGCRNLCNFCHAGFCMLPYYEYDPAEVFGRAREQLQNTGFSEITLTALSVSDYRQLGELLNMSLPYFNENGISVSLPSMKVDRTNLPLIDAVSDIRHSSLTFAVESADDEQRRRIHKKLSMDDLYGIIRTVYEDGWKLIKLYFMIGLPGYDTCDEAASIIAALKKIHELCDRRMRINVTISPFIPKPNTAFEREGFAPVAYLRETVAKVKSSLPRSISVKSHQIDSSRLEAFFARGDEQVAQVILDAYRRGAYLDSWNEFYRRDVWDAIVAEHSSLLEAALAPRTGALPWKIITAVDQRIIDAKAAAPMSEHRLGGEARSFNLDTKSFAEALERFEQRYEKAASVRLRFSKKGRARFISHIDFLEAVRRAVRCAGVPACFSRGFNKREKISAGFPAPLGIESEYEIIDIELYAPVDPQSLPAMFNAVLPEGLRVEAAVESPGTGMMLPGAVVAYRIEQADPSVAIAALDAGITTIKRTDKGGREISSRDSVVSYGVIDGALSIELTSGLPTSGRIDEILKKIYTEEAYADILITKVAQYRVTGGKKEYLI